MKRRPMFPKYLPFNWGSSPNGIEPKNSLTNRIFARLIGGGTCGKWVKLIRSHGLEQEKLGKASV